MSRLWLASLAGLVALRLGALPPLGEEPGRACPVEVSELDLEGLLGPRATFDARWLERVRACDPE